MSEAVGMAVRARTTGLLSVVYTSEAVQDFTELDLAVLLGVSRSNNEPQGVTGLLLADGRRFLQALEGPEPAVRATLARIALDPRHVDVRVIEESVIDERRFGSWAMGYQASVDRADWYGSPEAVAPDAGSRAAALLASFRER
ncbi:BLUF domain-containing protein [Amnibacterium kyonggiense]